MWNRLLVMRRFRALKFYWCQTVLAVMAMFLSAGATIAKPINQIQRSQQISVWPSLVLTAQKPTSQSNTALTAALIRSSIPGRLRRVVNGKAQTLTCEMRRAWPIQRGLMFRGPDMTTLLLLESQMLANWRPLR